MYRLINFCSYWLCFESRANYVLLSEHYNHAACFVTLSDQFRVVWLFWWVAHGFFWSVQMHLGAQLIWIYPAAMANLLIQNWMRLVTLRLSVFTLKGFVLSSDSWLLVCWALLGPSWSLGLPRARLDMLPRCHQLASTHREFTTPLAGESLWRHFGIR